MGLRRGTRRAAALLAAGAFAWVMAPAGNGMAEPRVDRRAAPLTFVPPAPRAPGLALRHERSGLPEHLAAAVAAASVGALPARADEGGADLGKFLGYAWTIITKGSLETNDPTTEEGAKAMGLAFPLPKNEDLPQATFEDAKPILIILGFALLYGIFVVPTMMERADGSKTIYFEEKEEEDAKPENADEIDTAAAVIKVKRMTKAEEPIAPKKGLAPKKKKAAGFSKKS
mmetsp:Transcript_109327/g.326962  ORF Transcript_109327/g.326962 Transcript_109327/m.326962 type:complete len:229 (-) Transcript_109327:61-747(-)